MTVRALYNRFKKVENPGLLGVQLGLEYHEVKKLIRQNLGDLDSQILEICCRWMDTTENPTWEVVSAALKDRYPEIANSIIKNHLPFSCKLS